MSGCNTSGRPSKDDSFQNLTVNDTLRIYNLLKSTKAEISRVCALTGQITPLQLSGTLKYTGEGSNALSLFAFPSGTTIQSNQAVISGIDDFWFTSEKINKITFQVDALSAENTDLVVSLMFSENPNSTPTDIITIPLTLTSSTIASDVYVMSDAEIPTGYFLTIRVTSSAQNITSLVVSWTLLVDT